MTTPAPRGISTEHPDPDPNSTDPDPDPDPLSDSLPIALSVALSVSQSVSPSVPLRVSVFPVLLRVSPSVPLPVHVCVFLSVSQRVSPPVARLRERRTLDQATRKVSDANALVRSTCCPRGIICKRQFIHCK